MNNWFHKMVRRTSCVQIAGWILVFCLAASATMDAPSFRTDWYYYAVFWLAFAGAFAWKGVPAVRSLQDPSTHPAARRLNAEENLALISQDIDRERRSPSAMRDGWGWTITNTYLVQSAGFMFDVYRLSDVLWAYIQVCRTSVSGIPAGTTYYAVFKFVDGEATMRGSQSEVLKFLQLAETRAPWAVFGHSRELEKLYQDRRLELQSIVVDRRCHFVEEQSCQSYEAMLCSRS